MSNPTYTAPNFSTQTASTYKANIDSSMAANGADYINLGFSYAVGTGIFTVHDAEGVALSSTNPGFIRFADKATPGQSIYVSVEANQAFIDDNGASEIIDNLFGTVTAIAWANDTPFYLYGVVSNDKASVAMMISRVPHLKVAPVVGLIGAPDDAVADNEFSFFSLDNIDETLYDGNPCTLLGSFNMRKTASDDWTVQTLDNTHGIGQFQEGVSFTFPLTQNGASTGTFLLPNAGAAPVFTNNLGSYTISKEGQCTYTFFMDADGGTDGSGAVASIMAVPLAIETLPGWATFQQTTGSGAVSSATGGTHPILFYMDTDFSTQAVLLFETDNSQSVVNSDFTNGARQIYAQGQYLIRKAT